MASKLVRYLSSGYALVGCVIALLVAQTAPSIGSEPTDVGVHGAQAGAPNIEKAVTSQGTAPSLPHALAVAVEDFRRAQKEGNRDVLDRMLADNYVLIKGNAETNDKARLIADLTDPAMKIDQYLLNNSRQIVWSDGALVIAEIRLIGAMRGKVLASHLYLADVWQRQAGHWRVVFSTATHFPDK